MSAIGLKSQIWNNNFRSLLLIALYPFLIAFLIWAIAFVSGWAFGSANLMATCIDFDDPSCRALHDKASQNAVIVGLSVAKGIIAAYWPLIFSVVGLWFIIAYFFQTRMVRALSHAHPVTREEEPELYNMVENLCISRGMKVPRLEIIETNARNAFASGVDQSSYAITVTRGLLQSLQKDEVEAVLGHELTHIINGDVRLLIVSIIFTGMVGFFAQMVWSSIRFNIYGGRRRSDIRVYLFLLMVAGVLWAGYLATIFTRFALSRRREYMADAGAIELTKNPEAMMRALLRISGKDRIPEATNDIALMCIENRNKFFGLFMTHPPIEKRIQAISETTNTPIPELKPGLRADNQARFKSPEDRNNPWLTAQRPGRNANNPWTQSSDEQE